MNIGNIELTRGKLIIVICGVIALIVLVVVYVPLIKELRTCCLESESCENQVINARKTIESTGKIDAQEIPITEKNISGSIDKFTKYCSLAGISVLSISPKEMTKHEDLQFKVLPIDMEIRSTFQQFASFIGSLVELKSGLIKVRGFDLTPDAEDRLKVRAKLALDMYLAI